jgi:phage shock protein PspC (stress-responsive transcriptional regulator)
MGRAGGGGTAAVELERDNLTCLPRKVDFPFSLCKAVQPGGEITMHFDRPVWREAIDWLTGRPRLAAVCLFVILLPAIASATILSVKIGMINFTSLKNTILIDAAAQIAGLLSTSFAQLVIIVSVHWAIVLNTKFSIASSGWTLIFRYLWRSLTIWLLAGFLGGLCSGLAKAFGLDDTSHYFLFGLIGVFGLVLTARWGTWLPASVVGGNPTLAAAKIRSKTSFGYILSQLMIYVFPAAALSAYEVHVITTRFGNAFYFNLYLQNHAFMHSIHALAWALITLVGTVMGAIVLSRAYLMGEANRVIPTHVQDM